MKLFIHDYAGHPFPVGLSRELACRGHEVVHAFASELLTPRGNLQRLSDDPAGLSFRAVAMSPDYRRFKYSFLRRRSIELAYGRELVRAVLECEPDVIISGQTPSEPQWMMMRQALALNIPVFTWVQDFYSIAVEMLARRKLPLVGWLAGRWYRHIDRQCFRGSSGVVAITADFRPILRRFGVRDEDIAVIPNWAPIEDVPVREKTNAWARKHDLDGRFVFLYSGTLAMKHDPRLLVRLAEQFREDDAVRVVVVSEGPGRDYLANEKRTRRLDNLLLLPFQGFRDMPEVLATGDVLLAVLENEAGVFSVPSKILTYLCAQRPILAAMPLENLAARIVGDARAGLVVSPDDGDAWLEAAGQLRGFVAKREAMAASARAYAEVHFKIGAVADRFEGLFRGALQPSHQKRWSFGVKCPAVR